MTGKEPFFIETKRIGTILRVTAIDAATGTEVVFQAPAKTSREAIHKLALSKLQYVLNKK